MPRQIDHDERRALLVAAVWRIVQREGVPAASVRGVAAEAGLSTGSVRHFFTTQPELLHFAMQAVIDAAVTRVADGAPRRTDLVQRGRVRAAVVDLLSEVLPLDDQRLAEARVWAAFAGEAVTDPNLADIRKRADDAVAGLCRTSLADLARLGRLSTRASRAVEIERLHALLDGLTTHILTDRLSPAAALAVLDAHLGELVARPAPRR